MDPSTERRNGLVATAAAFTFWGVVPIYWKAVRSVSAHEMIALRVLWAIPFAALLLTWVRGWPDVRAALRSRRTLAILATSAALIGINWFVFIEAMTAGKVLQSSLGYFINPLVNIVLGYAFLGERLRRLQWVAVALAGVGVVNQVASVGAFPWIALILAFSFALYGLVRKVAPVRALPGLFVEATLLIPLALGYMLWVVSQGTSTFVAADATTQWLVPIAGMITAMPLVWFAYGARRISLATVGLLQFIAPTGQFLLAVLAYDEPFTQAHVVTFALIWAGVALYLFDMRRGRVTPQ